MNWYKKYIISEYNFDKRYNNIFLKDYNPLPGSCDIAAEKITINLLEKGITNFNVIEGYISFEDYDWNEAHTWIELLTGEIIDPTNIQWGIDVKDIEYLSNNRKTYSPEQYLQLCKKYPANESKYKKAQLNKISQIYGEYWINDMGNVQDADGEYNHESYVIDEIISNKLDLDPENFDFYEIIKKPDNELAKMGFDKDEIDVLKTRQDGREYAMKNWGWIRVSDKYVQFWYLTPKIMKNIANGLYEAFGNDAFIGNFVLESLSNNKIYDNVPYGVIDKGNIMALRQYMTVYGIW